jgi:WD40 repeat protein
LRTLSGDQTPVSYLAFSPDEKVLAVAHLNGTVELWDHESGNRLLSFAAHADGVWPIVFSPDGKIFAVGNGDGSVSLRRPGDAMEIGRIPAQPELGSTGAVAFSPDNRLLAVGGSPARQGDSPVFLWALSDATADAKRVAASRIAKWTGHREHTYALAFSSDGRLLASANQDRTATLWNVQTLERYASITTHADFVYDVAFSPDGTALATLGRDSLKLRSMKGLREAK